MSYRFLPYFALLLFCLAFAGNAAALPSEGTRLKLFFHDLVNVSTEPDAKDRASAVRALVAKDGDILFHFLDPKRRTLMLRESGIESLPLMPAQYDFLAQTFAEMGVSKWDKMSIEKRTALLAKVPDFAILQAVTAMDGLIETAPYSKLPALQIVMTEIEGVDLPGFSKADLHFLGGAFLQYFDRLPVRMKRRMLLAWLALPTDATMAKQLEGVLQNAGPALQKLFQLVGKESTSPELKEITLGLLSTIKPVPFADVKKVIEEEYGLRLLEIFKSMEVKPLGTATIGQTHRGVTLAGEDTIIKVIKPGIPEDMEDEFRVLREVMKGNQASADFVDTLADSFLRELDLRNEAKNLTRGQVYADAKLGVSVPRVARGVVAKEHVIAMDAAPGKNLSKSTLDPRVRAQALSNVIEKWFEEVMFGKGFFHGDLHPGNLMLEERKGKSPPFRISMIDFGATGELSLEQRRELLYFFASVQDENAENVLESLGAFGDVEKVDKKALAAEISSILGREEMLAEDKMNQIIGAALKRGTKLNTQIVMFSRASLFVSNELTALNAEIREKFPKHSVVETGDIYRRVALRSLGGELKDRILQRHGQFVWDSSIFRSLVYGATKSYWRSAKKSCGQFFRVLTQY